MSYLLDKLPSLSPPVIDEPWRKALRDAAELIREKGWCQHSFGDTAGPSCLIGAIFKVSGWSPTTANAMRAVTKAIGGHSAMRWNDHPSRTKDEVISALLQAAGKE